MSRDTHQREVFKKRIADAAVEEFSRKGFINARIDAIAGSMGVDPTKIYYYAGGKEKIYRETFERVFGHILKGCMDRFFTESDKRDPAPDECFAALMYLASGAAYRPGLYKIKKLCELDMIDGRNTCCEYRNKYLGRYYSRIESVIRKYSAGETPDIGMFLFGLVSFINSSILIDTIMEAVNPQENFSKPEREDLYVMILRFSLKLLKPEEKNVEIPLLDEEWKNAINLILSDIDI